VNVTDWNLLAQAACHPATTHEVDAQELDSPLPQWWLVVGCLGRVLYKQGMAQNHDTAVCHGLVHIMR
jgi:hypothetical protein